MHGDSAHPQWSLTAGEMTYVIGVNNENMLQSIYWGKRLDAGVAFPIPKMASARASFDAPIGMTPLEYPAWGEGLFTEPALKVDSANGDRTLILKYSDQHRAGSVLEIVLKDAAQPITVHLYYQVYPQGILARWSRIENQGVHSVSVEQAASATWNLPEGKGYEWSWLTGQWGGEWQLHTEPVNAGTQMIESRRGSTSHQANPWFSVGRVGETTETNGPVWFGQLAWSGSWRLSVEDTALDTVRITGGYNPFDFGYSLQGGGSLDTPRFYAGYTSRGNGEASRILHRLQREEILPTHAKPRLRPILYNSWEATGFNVSEQGQVKLAERAAALGVERFVIDDGWFGQRKDDRAGLGDWTVNSAKFPNGLKPVIDRVHSLGMDFGLWVEPEMVNRDSDLYRAHPDWVMSFPDRQQTEQRHQLVLNLAKPEVKQYIFNVLDRLLKENDIAFLKWDYNRNWSEPGWQGISPDAKSDRLEEQKSIYVRYVENLYDVLAQLRRKYPKLEIESCSGGGGRVDDGILAFTDEVWPSDNTDALDRLTLQDGFTRAYTPEIMSAWVTDVPNHMNNRVVPLQFRFLVAMQGAMGIGGNLNRWTPEDLEQGSRLVSFYKKVRSTVQNGSLYRLQSPQAGDASQVEYVAADGSQALVLAYLHSERYRMPYPRVVLQGLNPATLYRIKVLEGSKYDGPAEMLGAVLMSEGVRLGLTGDYDSTAVELEPVAR